MFLDMTIPHGHAHIKFNNVRVPKDNLLLGEGGDLKLHKEDWGLEEFITV